MSGGVVASVLARLRNHSKSSGAPFQQVLQQYAMERFLYRISKSKHAQSVILKGALLLKTIGIPRARPTLDIDMLRKGKADQTSLLALVTDCATLDVEADGLTFLADSAMAEEITKDSEYKGTRILMDARMDNVRLRIQIDFGVGDVMVPGPRMVEYPVFLGNDTFQLLAYPVESAIAEKLEAMVALGNANSRMKDFYDVWIYSNHLDFNTNSLLKAIDATFKHRETPLAAEEFEALMTSLAGAHRIHWNAFVKKIGDAQLMVSVRCSRISKFSQCRCFVRSRAVRNSRRSGRPEKGGYPHEPAKWVLLPNPLPTAERPGDSRGRQASRFQQLTDFYLRLRGFDKNRGAIFGRRGLAAAVRSEA